MNISTLLIGEKGTHRRKITDPLAAATLPTPPSEAESLLPLPQTMSMSMSVTPTPPASSRKEYGPRRLPPEIWAKVFDEPSTVADLAHLWVEGRQVSHAWQQMIEAVFKKKWVPQLRIVFEGGELFRYTGFLLSRYLEGSYASDTVSPLSCTSSPSPWCRSNVQPARRIPQLSV